jgi:carboxylesterase type B
LKVFDTLSQIFESGTAGSIQTLGGATRQPIWETFVAAVPECANSTSSDSFECLMTASASTLIEAGQVALNKSEQNNIFQPVLDGPKGVFPKPASDVWASGSFAKIPFITGANLDEGELAIS